MPDLTGEVRFQILRAYYDQNDPARSDDQIRHTLSLGHFQSDAQFQSLLKKLEVKYGAKVQLWRRAAPRLQEDPRFRSLRTHGSGPNSHSTGSLAARMRPSGRTAARSCPSFSLIDTVPSRLTQTTSPGTHSPVDARLYSIRWP